MSFIAYLHIDFFKKKIHPMYMCSFQNETEFSFVLTLKIAISYIAHMPIHLAVRVMLMATLLEFNT